MKKISAKKDKPSKSVASTMPEITMTTAPSRRRPWKNGALLILFPIVAAIVTFYYIFGSQLMTSLANRGNDRLVTQGWQSAQSSLEAEKPQARQKYAYYKLQQGQDLTWAASHFSVSLAELQKLNPGQAVWGTTIMVPPVEAPLSPLPATEQNTTGIAVSQAEGIVYVNKAFGTSQANLTIPQLMALTQSQGAITQLSAKTFLINKPLYVQNNIRVDVTSSTVSTLFLRSASNFDITTLTFQNSVALFDGVQVSTYDPATQKPDNNVSDGRSFLRAYQNSRMDILNTQLSYLGMTLDQIRDPSIRTRLPFVSQGGVYGVAWRIGSGTYGTDIATGWVEKSTFEHNHIGAFTFGAQGMMWRNNLFTANEVYGLDPHDDSNNATIEYNRFIANGKHGFIVSKRCDYNVIKDNISVDNKLHGFMLHDNSDYNVFEDNIAIGNQDNFVIYGGSFDTVTNNESYNPRGSHVRINQSSYENYISDNAFYGGKKGVYLYDGVNGVDISGNTFYNVTNQLITDGATRVFYGNNQTNLLGYEIKGSTDRVVFGVNKINKKPTLNLQPLQTITAAQAKHSSLTDASATALQQR